MSVMSCARPLRAKRACKGGALQPSRAAVRYWLRMPAGMRAPWQLFPLRTGRHLVVPVRGPFWGHKWVLRGALTHGTRLSRRWKGDSHINNFFDDARERFKPSANPSFMDKFLSGRHV